MGKIYADNSESIGNTSRQVESDYLRQCLLPKSGGAQSRIFSEMPYRRENMVWDAEKRGKLKAGMAIVEPTSGNGILMDMCARHEGISLYLPCPLP